MATTKKKTTRKRKPASGTTPRPAPVLDDELDISGMGNMRPVLYLDLLGTLVLQEGSRFRLAPFAREFIARVQSRFRLRFLTELSESAALEVSRLLEATIEYGHYRRGLGKVSGIDFATPFLWVDHAPTARDLMRLAEERCSARLITVNSKDGVTMNTLAKIESCLEELFAPAR